MGLEKEQTILWENVTARIGQVGSLSGQRKLQTSKADQMKKSSFLDRAASPGKVRS